MNKLISLGWIAVVTFIVGSFIFAWILPDYSFVSQTISEIGEEGSAVQKHWYIFDLVINILMLLFFVGLFQFSIKHQLSKLPFIFLVVYMVAQFGVLIYESPHPYHNTFGALNLAAYISPLIFFIFWKDRFGASFKIVSLTAFIICVIGVVLNLNPMFDPLLFSMDYYGLAQRLVIFTFLFYCLYMSIYIKDPQALKK